MKACPKCGTRCEPAAEACSACGAQLGQGTEPADGHDELIGVLLAGKYEIRAQIGAGAMGAIYRATQISLGREVCVKVMHAHLATDLKLAKRFQREALAASALQHPNIIQVLEFGEAQVRVGEGATRSVLYLVMEYLDGHDLSDILYAEGPLDPLRVMRLAVQVARALDEAHARGVVHRDLKPENIMVSRSRRGEERCKVLDFGIAKILDGGRGDMTKLTLAGTVCGTPEYMSPEQARGKPIDGRSDLYALGIILYQLVTGQIPFDGPSPIDIVHQQIMKAPVRPTRLRPDVPILVEKLILRLMSKDPAKRPATAFAAARELERAQQVLTNSRTTPLQPWDPKGGEAPGGASGPWRHDDPTRVGGRVDRPAGRVDRPAGRRRRPGSAETDALELEVPSRGRFFLMFGLALLMVAALISLWILLPRGEAGTEDLARGAPAGVLEIGAPSLPDAGPFD